MNPSKKYRRILTFDEHYEENKELEEKLLVRFKLKKACVKLTKLELTDIGRSYMNHSLDSSTTSHQESGSTKAAKELTKPYATLNKFSSSSTTSHQESGSTKAAKELTKPYATLNKFSSSSTISHQESGSTKVAKELTKPHATLNKFSSSSTISHQESGSTKVAKELTKPHATLNKFSSSCMPKSKKSIRYRKENSYNKGLRLVVLMTDVMEEIGCLKTVTVKKDSKTDRYLLTRCECGCGKQKEESSADSDASTVKIYFRPTKRRLNPQLKAGSESEDKKPKIVSDDWLITNFSESDGELNISPEDEEALLRSPSRLTTSPNKSADKSSESYKSLETATKIVVTKENDKKKILSRVVIKNSEADSSRKIKYSDEVSRRTINKIINKYHSKSDERRKKAERIVKIINCKLKNRSSVDEDLRTVIISRNENASPSGIFSSLLMINDNTSNENCNVETESTQESADLRNIINRRNQSKQHLIEENVSNVTSELGNVRSRLGRQLSNEEFQLALNEQGQHYSSQETIRSFKIPKKNKEAEIQPASVVYEPAIESGPEEWPAHCPLLTHSHLKPIRTPSNTRVTSFQLNQTEATDLQDPDWTIFKEQVLNRSSYYQLWNNQPTPNPNYNLSVQNFNLRRANLPPKYAPWYDAQKRYYEALVPNTFSRVAARQIFDQKKHLAMKYFENEIAKEDDNFEAIKQAYREKYKNPGIETLKYKQMKDAERENCKSRHCKKINELQLMRVYTDKRLDLAEEEISEIRKKFNIGRFEGGRAILDDWEVDEFRETDAFLLKIVQSYQKPKMAS